MPKRGGLGHDMMFRSTTIQARRCCRLPFPTGKHACLFDSTTRSAARVVPGHSTAHEQAVLCVLQVNLDFEDEADMVQKMRIGIALQPAATALFANSPFRDGGDTGAQPIGSPHEHHPVASGNAVLSPLEE